MLQQILSLSLGNTVLLLSALYTVFLLVQFALDPLRDIPGPLLARFTRFWYFFEIYKGSFERSNIELHKKYGPIVRIAPAEYSIDDVEAAKTIYGHGNAFVKVSWERTFGTDADIKAGAVVLGVDASKSWDGFAIFGYESAQTCYPT
jgi:hypothetical protein